MHAHIEGKLGRFWPISYDIGQNRPKFFIQLFDIETDRPKLAKLGHEQNRPKSANFHGQADFGQYILTDFVRYRTISNDRTKN